MLTGKGLAYSLLAALLAGGLWVGLIVLSGWNLWVLAPAIGGAAGYGMMRATQMRGGVIPGLTAAACTIAVILGGRAFVVSRESDTRIHEAAMGHVVDLVAADMESEGVELLTDDGEYTAEVHQRAEEAWSGFSPAEREEVLTAVREESGLSESGLLGLGMLLDLGLFGLICTGLAAGTAFKTAGMSLEQALVDKGLNTDEVTVTAQRLRDEDARKTTSPTPAPSSEAA